MSMIEVDGLTRKFGDFTAVDHISFEVDKGTIFGFLGPNGAGKSTTIRMLCTLLRPSEGKAKVAGFDIVREASRVRQHIGLVAEKIILYDQLTAVENLTIFGRLNNMPEAEIRKEAKKWLSRLQMEQWQNQRVGTFSTGMKQRINIARALLHHPDLLVLDEPTLGLDPQTTRAIHDFILELSGEGITIILTTHDMTEAESLCQQIAIMDHARIIALDTVSGLKKLLSAEDGHTIHIEIFNQSQTLIEDLEKLEAVESVALVQENRLKIRTSTNEALPLIVNTISNSGSAIRAINTPEPNLEDVFLYLTGREIRDDTAVRMQTSRRRGPQAHRIR